MVTSAFKIDGAQPQLYGRSHPIPPRGGSSSSNPLLRGCVIKMYQNKITKIEWPGYCVKNIIEDIDQDMHC